MSEGSVFALSPQQRRAWQVRSVRKDAGLRFAIRVTGRVDRGRLEAAVQTVVDRHEILRTLLVQMPGLALPGQQIGDRVDDPVAGDAPEDSPVRIGVTHDATESLVSLHLAGTHADRHTADILLAEVAGNYAAGDTVPPELQYADYAGWVEDLVLEPQGALMRSRWEPDLAAALAAPRLPFTVASSRGESGMVARDLTAAEVESTVDEARALSLWKLLLARMTGSDEIVIAAATSVRVEPGLTSMPGPLTSYLPVRRAISGAETVRAASRAEAGRLTDVRSAAIYFSWPIAGPENDVRYAFEYQVWPAPVVADDAVFELAACDGFTDSAELLLRYVRLADRVRVELLFDGAAVTSEQAEDLVEQYAGLMAAAQADPDRILAELHGPTVDDQNALLSLGCGPVHPENLEFSPHWARHRPDAVALAEGSTLTTYGMLETETRRLATVLRRHGAHPETVIAVVLPRGRDAVVAMLATMQAGAIYAPIDPANPVARIAEMLGAIKPVLLVTTDRTLAAAVQIQVVDPRDGVAEEPSTALPQLSNGAAACLIHTSGSTGRPKGVVLTYGGLRNRIACSQRITPLGQADRYLWSAGLGFDFTLYEVLTPLSAGATLVIPDPVEDGSPHHLAELICRERVTALHFTPSMAGVVASEPRFAEAGDLRLIFLGGEPSTPQLVSRLQTCTSATIVNQYGPTEGTIDVTAWTADESAGANVYIGHPMDNTVVHVLDEQLRPTAGGMTGEMYLGGVALARGYHRMPAATAERFIPNPFGPPGTRLYRTGDFGRRRWDGVIEFLGRRDRQAGVRGYRIELGEVEAVLASCEGVTAAAVIVLDSESPDARLVGFVCTASPRDVSDIRAELLDLLPAYMIPQVILPLAHLPLTAQHKVDQAALATMAKTAAQGTWIPPQGPVEAALAAVWQELLGLGNLARQVGRHDDFYRLGGHSLIALRVLSFIHQELRVPLSLPDLLAGSTVSVLAATVESGESTPGQSAAAATRWLAARS